MTLRLTKGNENHNTRKVAAVAGALLKHETLNADEVRRLCLGETLDKPSLSGILSEEGVPPAPKPAAPPSPKPEAPDALPGGSLPHPGLG